MARGEALWFSFKGIDSRDMGVRVARLPDIPVAEARGRAVEIPGRDGSLWLEDGAFEDIGLTVELELLRWAEAGEITGWLCGAGELVLGSLPEYRYEARIGEGFALKRGTYALGRYGAAVPFICKPFRYLAGRPAEKCLTAPGGFRGAGNWFARPVISVYASGDVQLTVNDAPVLLEGVDGHITLDCDAMMAFRDGANVSPQVTLLSDDEGWPRLNPGENRVDWSGEVKQVVIQPNWRWR